MSVTVELSADEVAQIKHFTQTESDAAAVTKAAREFLRTRKLRQLKAASGKVDYRDAPKPERTYKATEALETKLKEAQGANELDCPPDFFTEPLDD